LVFVDAQRSTPEREYTPIVVSLERQSAWTIDFVNRRAKLYRLRAEYSKADKVNVGVR
jgi:hypothetical protein